MNLRFCLFGVEIIAVSFGPHTAAEALGDSTGITALGALLEAAEGEPEGSFGFVNKER